MYIASKIFVEHRIASAVFFMGTTSTAAVGGLLVAWLDRLVVVDGTAHWFGYRPVVGLGFSVVILALGFLEWLSILGLAVHRSRHHGVALSPFSIHGLGILKYVVPPLCRTVPPLCRRAACLASESGCVACGTDVGR